MADARPTLLHLAQRYTQAQTDAVQPPDDRTYSAEVTSFPSNLLHHRSAHCQAALGPYTRLNIVTSHIKKVKYFFRKNYKKFSVISSITENSFIYQRVLALGLQAPASVVSSSSASLAKITKIVSSKEAADSDATKSADQLPFKSHRKLATCPFPYCHWA